MKKLLIVIGGLIVLVIAALLIAPMVIPVDTYKKEILAQVEKATGREARIDGDFGISLFPTVKFTAGKFSLANAKGGKADKMVSLEQLNVQVAVLPLIGGNVVIDSFVLDKPVINLEVDAQGRPNWVFTPAAGAAAGKPMQDGKEAAPAKADGDSGGGSGGLGISGLQLGDVRLVDGRIAYNDAKTGVSQTVDGINMSVSLPSMTSPMAANGSLVWNKEKIDLVLGIDNLNAFLAGTQTGLNATVAASTVKFDFKGKASSKPQMKASGTIDLDVPSVRKLAAWAGQPMDAPGTGFGPLKINGQIGVDGQKYSFTKAQLSLDAIQATGDFRFDGSGKVPYINAGLGTGMLDLNPYLPPEKKADAGTSTPAAPTGTGGNAQKPASQGWSTDPIDLSGLRAVNADIALNVAGLMMRKIKIGKSAINVALKGGRLTTKLTEMALYGGNGTATITADGAAAVPAVTAKFDLTGLQANPALSDAMAMDKIEGTLNTNIDVAMRGGSQKAMVSTLGGKGKVVFADGAIRGINIAAMARNAASAFLDSSARAEQKTDFAELSGTFNIVRGVLSNSDLTLLSPLLRVGGQGTVDMPNRAVNYRIEPKLVASTKGQGASADTSGIKVPVVVSGPWDNLSYKPDLAGVIDGIAKDPKKALEGLKNLIPGQGGSGGSGGGSAIPKPEDALKKLFGR
ncbi:MAG: AsmA protein [Paracoccaceae bacterium]|jgi:AsmA protein